MGRESSLILGFWSSFSDKGFANPDGSNWFLPSLFPCLLRLQGLDPKDPRNPAPIHPCVKCKPVKADNQYKSKLQFPLLASLNSFCGLPQDLGCQLRCRQIYKCWKRNFSLISIKPALQLLSTIVPYCGELSVAHQNKRAVPSPKVICTMMPMKILSLSFFSQLNQCRKLIYNLQVWKVTILGLDAWLKPEVSLLQNKTFLPVCSKRKPKAKEEETKCWIAAHYLKTVHLVCWKKPSMWWCNWSLYQAVANLEKL